MGNCWNYSKGKKKHQNRSKYLDICESNLYYYPIIVFTMDITVSLQTESRESVLMPSVVNASVTISRSVVSLPVAVTSS